MSVVGSAECHPFYAPWAFVGPQAARLQDAVDPESGEQRATRPAVVQIQRGKPEVVWPEWLQSSTVQPYPQWSERRVLE